MHNHHRLLLCACLLSLAACSKTPVIPAEQARTEQAEEKGSKDEIKEAKPDADVVHLSDAQVAAAGIQVAPVREVFGDSIEAPAIIAANPSRLEVVAIAVSGRITALHRNLGEAVRRGDALAVIESAEAAELKAELEGARRQLALAQITLQREERLHREKVSAEQDYLAARAAAGEAQTRVRLAEQRLSAAGGGGGGPLNRLTVRSPIKGHVIAREAVLGNVVAPNTELFRIADLSEVSVELALPAEAASRVRSGATVEVSADGRNTTGRISFVSPVVDPTTRQVRAVAMLPNPDGTWRVGETVRTTVVTKGREGKGTPAVPQAALQTVEDRPTVFVRTKDGFAVKHVVIGASNGGFITVVSGLASGERIAVTNSYVLKAELGKGEGGDDD